MIIAQDHIVSVHYTLTDNQGAILDSSRDHEPLEYLHGHHMMIPGFEKALEGASTGQELSFTVTPAEGYGEVSEEEIFDVARSEFNPTDDIQEGSHVQGMTESGAVRAFKVLKVTEDAVTLDGNHPLAGQTLNFDVEVMGVRPATAQELEHKHVHSHGHDH